MRAIILVSTLAIFSSSSMAAEVKPPPEVAAGFEAFAAKGIDAAWTAWDLEHTSKGIGRFEPLSDGDKGVFRESLSKSIQYAGKPLGAETIAIYPVGTSYRTVYVLWRFDKRPLFCTFVCYKAQDTWKIIHFFFSSDPRDILPSSNSGMLSVQK
jgi:hypothetical protein